MTILTTRRPGKIRRTHRTRPSYFDGKFENPYHTESLPQANILERGNSRIIQLAVPGLRKEDIRIDLDEDLLVISAKEAQDQGANGREYIEKGFDFSGFRRSFQLSKNLDRENIRASVQDGILEIELQPKEKISRKINVS